MESSIVPKQKEEVLIYLVECPEHVPGLRMFMEEDMSVAGGVHAIEAELERDTDRFVRVGVVEAENSGSGMIVKNEAIAALPVPSEHDWRIGRLSPAYGRNELERAIFNSEVRAARSLLARWKYDDDGLAIAFVPKKVRGGCLASLAASLCAVGEAFDSLRIAVIKYWYDQNWKDTMLCEELILAEFSVTVPIRVRWGYSEHLVAVDAMPPYCC